MAESGKEANYGLQPKNGPKSDTIRFEKDVFTVGNDPSSDLELKNDKILKRHAVLEKFIRSSEWYVKSFSGLQDPSGVCVDGVRIKKHQRYSLKEGNTIAFGDFEYVFCKIHDEQQSSTCREEENKEDITRTGKRKRETDSLTDMRKRLKSFEDEIKSLQLEKDKEDDSKCSDCKDCSFSESKISTSTRNVTNSSRTSNIILESKISNYKEQIETLNNKLINAEKEITALQNKVEQLEEEKYALVKNQIEVGRARDSEVSQLKLKLADSEIALVELKQENERLESEKAYLLSKKKADDGDILQLDEKLKQAEKILAKLKNSK